MSFILTMGKKIKDIVSDHFYWLERKKRKSYWAVIDHRSPGVRGIFMKFVGAIGSKAAEKKHRTVKPGDIIDKLFCFVFESLNRSNKDNDARDSMDLSPIANNYKEPEPEFAAARNLIYLVRHEELFIILRSDKFAIRSFIPSKNSSNLSSYCKLENSSVA